MLKNNTSNGYTMIEIAIVLILLGIITTVGVKYLTGITLDRKMVLQAEKSKQTASGIFAYVKDMKKLPEALDNTTNSVKDIFSNNYSYRLSNDLKGKDICKYREQPNFEISYCYDPECYDQRVIHGVAFILSSFGMNTQEDNFYKTPPQEMHLYKYKRDNDDTVNYYTLLELQAIAGCSADDVWQPLKFINESISPVKKSNAGSGYANIFINGEEDNKYRWCVTNFQKILNYDTMQSTKMYSGTEVPLQPNCNSDQNYKVGKNYMTIINTLPGSDNKTAIASFDVYVKDQKNKMIMNTFVYQLYQ